MAPTGPVSAIVLASGDDQLMRSTRPKSLHRMCGRAIVMYVLDALVDFGVDRAIVVGAESERLGKSLSEHGPDLFVEFVEPSAPGTAEAVLTGLVSLPTDLEDSREIVVVPADIPLLLAEDLDTLLSCHRDTDAVCTVMTGRADLLDGPAVLRRSDGRIVRLEPAHTLTEGEVATGIYCFRQSVLGPSLRRIPSSPNHGIDSLHAVVEVLSGAGYTVAAVPVEVPSRARRVMSRVDLAHIEELMRHRTNQRWLRSGVNMVDPARTYIDTTVRLSADVTLFPGTMLQGDTTVGERAEIGPDTRLVDCAIGADAVVEKTTARESEVGAGAHVGPFALLRPGAHVEPRQDTGAFYTA